MKHIISLGAGVQSSTMALMAAHGEIMPMPDCAIFADTQSEPQSVYEWLTWLETQLPFPVYRVTVGSLEIDETRIRRSKKSNKLYMKGSIPAFVLSTELVPVKWEETYTDNPLLDEDDRWTLTPIEWAERSKKGLLGRKCTSDYKIIPLQRKVREIIGIKRQKQGMDVLCEMMLGISTDEAHRMKDSRVAYIRNTFPLIEQSISRQDCLLWMQSHGYPEPPRSACVFCPFHSDDEWIRLRDDEPEEFARAIKFERSIQGAQRNQEVLRGIPYLHSSCQPLDTIDFQPKTQSAQASLFGNECEGMCGI